MSEVGCDARTVKQTQKDRGKKESRSILLLLPLLSPSSSSAACGLTQHQPFLTEGAVMQKETGQTQAQRQSQSWSRG
jgi:hypothetical protein